MHLYPTLNRKLTEKISRSVTSIARLRMKSCPCSKATLEKSIRIKRLKSRPIKQNLRQRCVKIG